MSQLNLGFASDNTAGAHPRIIEAIARANEGYSKPYAEDALCENSDLIFEKLFGNDVNVCFTLSGTGANVLALKSMLRPWQAVICSDVAHIDTEEAGAPEGSLGSKLLPVPSVNGKIKPHDIDIYLPDRKSTHKATPRVLSITQSTEKGTLYSLEEIRALCDYAHANELYVHMDGSRIANACAALNIDIKTMTGDAGVDVLSFGGAKNGLLFGEAVVFCNREFAVDYKTMRKHSLQLISKMRFVAAQFVEFFKEDLWLENARHANNMAGYLADELRALNHFSVATPEANGVFVKMDKKAIEQLMTKYYVYEVAPGEVRLMCSFATTKEEVDELVKTMKALIEPR